MRNPIRRSRKIGQTQGGRVKDGRPEEKWSRVFTRDVWERLSGETDGPIRILRENSSTRYYHPCTGPQIRKVLEQLPADKTRYLRAVVLRRVPKSDERLGIEARVRSRCVILNAFPKSRKLVWNRKPERTVFRHMAPWCDRWTRKGDKWILQWTKDEVNRYYLYHLLLHEIGHINQPRFHSSRKREEFAENFALEWARRLGAL